MRNNIISFIIIFQLVCAPIAMAGWEIVEREGKRFALIPSHTVVKMANAIQELENLQKEIILFKEFAGVQEQQIKSLRKSVDLYNLKEDMYRMREGVYREQVNYLSKVYEQEIKDNERLQLKRPSSLRWALFGGVVTISAIGFTAWIINKVK